MKKEYKAPTVEIVEFESTDVICTSGELQPEPIIEEIYKGGVNVGNVSAIDLMN